ncbi:MAG: two-component system response regulator [Candidatus Omnitrophota bacterium]
MNPKILIIDRSEHFIELICIRLLNYGYNNFKTAKCGRDGLKIVDFESPDIVILETRLEDIPGLKVCELIKEIHGSNVKVIIMSGLAEPSQMTQAKAAGADEYVFKTFDCVEILIAVKKLIAEMNVPVS